MQSTFHPTALYFQYVFGFVCETEKADDALVDFFVFFKVIIF
jgi:hypothetical protein